MFSLKQQFDQKLFLTRKTYNHVNHEGIPAYHDSDAFPTRHVRSKKLCVHYYCKKETFVVVFERTSTLTI